MVDTSYPPGALVEYPCGCSIMDSGTGYSPYLVRCSMHAAASDLLIALVHIVEHGFSSRTEDQARRAIAKAEAESE